MSDAQSTASAGQLEYLRQKRRRKKLILYSQAGLLAGFFLLWELLAYFGAIDPFIFSSPSRMANAFYDMLITGALWKHLGITVFETVLGFLLGTALGIGAAVALWWNETARRILDPYLVVLNSLPKTALAPIIIVWLGNNMRSIIATALLTSVVVTILSVLAGFLAVDGDKIKLLRTFGAQKPQILSRVVLPGAFPAMVNALKINVGLSFVGVIVGEFLVSSAGLGYLIVYGSQVFKLDWVMLSVLILALLAAGLYQGISLLEKRLLRGRV